LDKQDKRKMANNASGVYSLHSLIPKSTKTGEKTQMRKGDNRWNWTWALMEEDKLGVQSLAGGGISPSENA
jgi:hypothetical protein